MAFSNKICNVQIYYASQKGTAQSIAEDLNEYLRDKSINSELLCISHMTSHDLDKQSTFIFIAATTGDGEPPDTARKITREFRKLMKSNYIFNNFNYTVLGLGDTNYTNFCNFGKTLDTYLSELGGKRFYPCGWADDGTGLEIVVDPWIEALHSVLNSLFIYGKNMDASCTDGVLANSEISIAAEIPCLEVSKNFQNGNDSSSIVQYDNYDTMMENFHVEDVMSLEMINNHPLLKTELPHDAKLTIPTAPLRYLIVDLNEEVCGKYQHNGPFPSCSSILFDTSIHSFRKLSNDNSLKITLEVQLSLNPGTEVEFEPGDSFSILPENDKEEVDLFMSLLGLRDHSHHRYKVSVDPNNRKKNAQIPLHLRQDTSLRELVTNCLDIRTVPKKPFIRALVDYTSDFKEKRKLMEFVSKECPSAYIEQIREKSVSLLDLLLVFNSCKPTLSLIFEHMPKLTPRAYSITSSPLWTKNSISFAFNVIDIKKNEYIVFNRKGICTGFLQKLCIPKIKGSINEEFNKLTIEDDTRLQIYLRSNQQFRLPENPSTPIIMVGPGTGVAPFVGFLSQKLYQVNHQSAETGISYLFFGCRTEDSFIFKPELNDFIKDGILTNLFTSFSRQPNNNDVKYVQDNIKLHRNEVCRLLCVENAVVYICGDAKNMSRDVMETFVEIIQDYFHYSQSDARDHIVQLQLDKRYLQDVWF